MASHVGAAAEVPIPIECHPLKYVFQMSLTPAGCSGSAPPNIEPKRLRDQNRVKMNRNNDEAISGRLMSENQLRFEAGVNKSSSSKFSSRIEISRTSVISSGKI